MKADRLRPLFILVFAIISFSLGVFGYLEYFVAKGNPNALSDSIFHSVRLFFLEGVESHDIWQLEVARFLAPVTMVVTAILGALGFFREELGLFRLRFYSGHVIICGLSNKGVALVKQYRREGKRVVVIEKDKQNPAIGTCLARRAIVFVGDATDHITLTKCRAVYAESVAAVTSEDGDNIQIAAHLEQLLQKEGSRKKPLRCAVHISNHDMGSLFKQNNAFDDSSHLMDATCFSLNEMIARNLLNEHPLDFEPIRQDDEKSVHLVIVGTIPMAQSIALHAARTCHFANEKPLRITFLDGNIESFRERLTLKYPQFEKTAHLEFLKGTLETPKIFAQLKALAATDNALSTFVICEPDGPKAVTAALRLKEASVGMTLPIRVYCPNHKGLETLFDDDSRISVFGQLSNCCTPETVIGESLDVLAQKIHESYVNGCLADGEKIGDRPALVPWLELRQDFRNSCRQQADHIGVKLRAVDAELVPESKEQNSFEFSNEELELLARMEHHRWCADRWLSGWTYGKPRNDELRLHPNLIPWVELDEPTREFDRDAVRSISYLVSLAGYEVDKRVPT